MIVLIKIVNKNIYFSGLFIMGLVFVMVFVIALGIDVVNTVSPANNSWTGETNDSIIFTFNFTGENASASCELFINDTSFGVNSSVLNNTNTGIYANASISDGAKNWYVNCTNGSTTMSDIWFLNVDTTNPVVNITYPTATNYTTAPTTLNFTYTETNCENAWYSNDSGVTNYSVQACTSNFSNMVVANGSNTWIVYMNDSAGNENSSSVSFVFDIIDPVASASCSPSSVSVGETVTCTCSGTDSGSGINNSLTTAGSTPSTSTAGTFSYTCSVTDNVGNSDSDSASYSVAAVTSSGSSGSYPSYNPSASKLSAGYDISLGANYKVNFNIGGQAHILKVNSLSEGKASITISSDPITLNLVVGDTEKVDVDGDGSYDLSVFLKAVSSGRANFVLTSISELMTSAPASSEAEGIVDEGASLEAAPAVETSEKAVKSDNVWMWVVLVLVIVLIVSWRKGLFDGFGGKKK